MKNNKLSQFNKLSKKTYSLKNKAKEKGNQIIIFTAPPGAGKTSVINTIIELNYDINKVLEKHKIKPIQIIYVPGVTTRKIRKSEKPGYDFHFLSKKQFKKRQRKREFLLSFVSEPNYYAIDGPDIEKRLFDSEISNLFIYNLNAYQVPKLKKHFSKKPKIIFLNAPDSKTLEKRKSARGGMSKKEIKFRQKTVKAEEKQGEKISDIKIINDYFPKTIQLSIDYIFKYIIKKNLKIKENLAKKILTDINNFIKKNKKEIIDKIK